MKLAALLVFAGSLWAQYYPPAGGGGGSGVSSFNTRTGAVTLSVTDVNGATGCTFASGALTCNSYTGGGSNPFLNLPSNPTHTGASGDFWNNAGVLEFGATPVAILVSNASGLQTFLTTPSGANFNSLITAGGVPIAQNSQSTAYTTVLADGGKQILHPTGDNNARTFTIDSNANVAYPIGTTLTFVNQINTVTIAITSDTLVLAGAGSTGSRTLAANGIATAVKITSTIWIINGTGLT